MTRSVSGQILRHDGSPWAGARVSFRLDKSTYTTTSQYPVDRVDAVADESGNFAAVLWPSAEGLVGAAYICRLPDGEEFRFILPEGTTPITLSELRSLSNVPSETPQTLIEILDPYFVSQSEGDARYRQIGTAIPATEISGEIPDAQIPSSITRDSEAIDIANTQAAIAVGNHTALSDPHPQYLTQAEGNAAYQPLSAKLTTISGLTGTTPIRSDGTNGPLTDAEIPASIARDAEVSAAVTAHEAASDPHPQYLTSTEGNAAYQPLDSDLTAIGNLTTTGVIERTGNGTAATRSIGSAGAAALAATNDAALRTAAGVDRPLAENPWEPKNIYIATDRAKQSNSPVFRQLVDRFADTHLWGTVIYSGGADDAPFRTDGSYTTIPAGQLAVWEIDFAPLYPWTANGFNGMVYVDGRIVISSPFATGFPDFVLIEFYARNATTGIDEWFTAGTLTGFVAYTSKHLRINASTGGVSYNYLKKIRISAQGRSGGASYLNKFEYYPDGPNPTEQTYYFGRAGGNIFAPVVVRDGSGLLTTTIGQGTIRVNNGATLSRMLTATKTATGSNPETITVTGAAVGDIAFISEAVPAKVTAANTVSFNGTGLSGTIRATVMRFA